MYACVCHLVGLYLQIQSKHIRTQSEFWTKTFAHLHTLYVWICKCNCKRTNRWLDTLCFAVCFDAYTFTHPHTYTHTNTRCALIQIHFRLFTFCCYFCFALLSSCFAFTWTQFHHVNGVHTYMYARRRAH